MQFIHTRRAESEQHEISADKPDEAGSRYTRSTQTEPGRDHCSQTDDLRQFCRLRLYQVVPDWRGNNTLVGLYSFDQLNEVHVPKDWQPLDLPEGTELVPSTVLHSPPLERAGTTRLYERCETTRDANSSTSSERRGRAATRDLLSDRSASPDADWRSNATPTRDLAATTISDDPSKWSPWSPWDDSSPPNLSMDRP